VDKGENLTVNLGSTDEITVGKLAQMIVRLSKKEIKMRFDMSKPRGALSRKPDLAFIKRELNWEPRTSLKEGLERTYSWAKKRLKVS
jgi:UDP-glucuronate decarboxylase